ncbi:hypothetical protein MKW92_024885, partial [Papaver armeniacum]
IFENFVEAYSEAEKQILNSMRMQQQQQDLPLCEAEQGQPQENEVVMLEEVEPQQNEFVMLEEVEAQLNEVVLPEEVRSTVQEYEGVGNVDQEQLLILQNNYDYLRKSIIKRWNKKEKRKSKGKTVHYEVEELLNELYFKAYPDEKKKKKRDKGKAK